MGTITTLRPSSTSSGVGWTPSAGTLHGVTSDDSDATYATWSGSGSAMILGTPVDSPPLGERRHQVRLRARGEDGDAWWAVRLASGGLIAGAAAQFTSSPGTVTGSWGFGAPLDGSTVLYTYVTGQSTGVKIEELYLDVDSRLAPTFTPQVLDGSGTDTTTISDTAQPSLRADSPDLDGLAARQYRYWVTLNGAIIWDTGVTGGSALTRQVEVALDNGSYIAHFQIWTTLGSSTAYASDEETVDFTVSVGLVPVPDNPVADPVDGTPFYELEVCAPFTGDFDDDQAWIEIQRVDCPIGGHLLLPGLTGSNASTPDPGPTTDLQVTVRARRSDNWLPSVDDVLVAQFNSGGDQRSWRLVLNADGGGDPALEGRPQLSWSPDGTGPSEVTAYATERPVIDVNGEVILRVTLDTDDGAGGWTVLFEQQDGLGDWHQVGDLVSNSGGGTTSLFDAATPIEVGTRNNGTFVPFTGSIYFAEVRDGATGAIIASPDFTGHTAGTTSFTDDQGNLWTVNGSAQLTSDQRLVSVAILGPLETGECADYVDYTLPRTGQAVTCDHPGEQCCSYYRARTIGRIDGQLLISTWSDAYNPGVARGLIAMWPSTAASLPDGWNRVTDLDAKYPKGIATSSTEPGTVGGAATHTHTTPGHTHDTSHLHTTTSPTAAATGTVNAPNTAGALKALTTHTHTRPSTDSATVVSGSTSPGTDTENNDPARLTVIFMESDGSQLGVPDGALALAPDITPTGWTTYANATNRFLKGAAAAGDGGATAASSLDSHVHAVDAHTHTGTSHSHTSAATGNFSSTLAPATGSGSVISAATHNHAITVNAASSQALASASGGNSGAAGTLDPPYRNLRVYENTSGDVSLPVGLICAWRGSLGTVPKFWQLCDGTNGTPDMSGVYPRGATASIGTTGGSSAAHTHTGSSHTHTTTGHSHTSSTAASAAATSTASTTATVAIATAAHTHALVDTASTTPTVASTSTGTLASTTSEPPFEEVAFVQLMEEPTPPPVPETFCLTWDDDEQLIRTTGPDGPLWAAVGGKFTWDVDRPFTASVGVMGGRYVTSSEPGGRNLHMTAAVENEADLAILQAVLNRPLVLVSPSDSDEVWAAPIAASVKIIEIGRIRQVTADFIATGPQPEPQLADVG